MSKRSKTVNIENVEKLWADPRHQTLCEVLHLLDGNKLLIGGSWEYAPIQPKDYLPVLAKVNKALNDLVVEYKV
jgi:hypothetical protein